MRPLDELAYGLPTSHDVNSAHVARSPDGDRPGGTIVFHFRSRQRGLIAALAPAALATILGLAVPGPATAAGRGETLVVVTEEGPSTLDIDAATANVQTHEVSWNIY